MRQKSRPLTALLLSLTVGLLVACGGGGGGAPAVVPETMRSFVSNQAPSVVIGVNPSAPADAFLGTLAGNGTVGPDGKLYLPAGDRIYVYSSVPTGPKFPSNAEYAITTAGTDASDFGLVQTIVFSGNKMIAADRDKNRVLIWNAIPNSNSSTWAPAVVVGQSALAGTAADCTLSSLNTPESLQVIGGNLVVADSGNGRVLIFDGIPNANGTPALRVLGNTECPRVSPASPETDIGYPSDVAYDTVSGTLIVTDTDYHRVLMWTVADVKALTDGQLPDKVLGQANLSGSGSSAGNGFNAPVAVAVRAGRMAVLDMLNSRVLIWNAVPTCATVAPGCSVDFGSPVSIGQTSLGIAYGLSFTGLNQLLVADDSHSRFVLFTAP